MQDGVLYYRTSKSDAWQPSVMDGKYATWNLNAINPKILAQKRVQSFPLSSQDYEDMLNFEDERKDFDLDAAAYNAKELVRQFNTYAFDENLSGVFSMANTFEYDLFSNCQDITNRMMCQNGGKEWFAEFMTSWIDSKNKPKDMYAESNYRLNVMTKMTFGKMVVLYARLIRNNSTITADDTKLMTEYLKEADILNRYIQSWLDERNMPVFPACDADGNPQYLPKNCYFMMGDNRFNSLDLRHAKDYYEKDLTEFDKHSVQYYSIIGPQYIHQKYIIGKPTFRFLPTDRMGRVR